MTVPHPQPLGLPGIEPQENEVYQPDHVVICYADDQPIGPFRPMRGRKVAVWTRVVDDEDQADALARVQRGAENWTRYLRSGFRIALAAADPAVEEGAHVKFAVLRTTLEYADAPEAGPHDGDRPPGTAGVATPA